VETATRFSFKAIMVIPDITLVGRRRVLGMNRACWVVQASYTVCFMRWYTVAVFSIVFHSVPEGLLLTGRMQACLFFQRWQRGLPLLLLQFSQTSLSDSCTHAWHMAGNTGSQLISQPPYDSKASIPAAAHITCSITSQDGCSGDATGKAFATRQAL
jgi:hypothetical protein